MSFTKQEIEEIRYMSEEFLGNKLVIAAHLGILLSKFESKLLECEEAQLAYELGLAKATGEGVQSVKSEAKKNGGVAALRYIGEIMNLSSKSNAANSGPKIKAETSEPPSQDNDITSDPIKAMLEYRKNDDRADELSNEEPAEDPNKQIDDQNN